jgi:hypothetical protein
VRVSTCPASWLVTRFVLVVVPPAITGEVNAQAIAITIVVFIGRTSLDRRKCKTSLGLRSRALIQVKRGAPAIVVLNHHLSATQRVREPNLALGSFNGLQKGKVRDAHLLHSTLAYECNRPCQD